AGHVDHDLGVRQDRGNEVSKAANPVLDHLGLVSPVFEESRTRQGDPGEDAHPAPVAAAVSITQIRHNDGTQPPALSPTGAPAVKAVFHACGNMARGAVSCSMSHATSLSRLAPTGGVARNLCPNALDFFYRT